MSLVGDVAYISKGDQTNIKITTMEDVYLFEGYLLMKEKRLLKDSINN